MYYLEESRTRFNDLLTGRVVYSVESAIPLSDVFVKG